MAESYNPMGGKGNANWLTPPELFAELDSEFHFATDAAATEETALAPRYLGPDHRLEKMRDALVKKANWTRKGPAFCNPPYSPAGGGVYNWVKKGLLEAKRGEGSFVVLLVPPNMGTRYMQLAHDYADEVRFFTRRLAFVHPETGEPMRSNRYDSCLIVFGPGPLDREGPCQYSYVEPP